MTSTSTLDWINNRNGSVTHLSDLLPCRNGRQVMRRTETDDVRRQIVEVVFVGRKDTDGAPKGGRGLLRWWLEPGQLRALGKKRAKLEA